MQVLCTIISFYLLFRNPFLWSQLRPHDSIHQRSYIFDNWLYIIIPFAVSRCFCRGWLGLLGYKGTINFSSNAGRRWYSIKFGLWRN